MEVPRKRDSGKKGAEMRPTANNSKLQTVLFALALGAFSAAASGCVAADTDEEADADVGEEAVAEAAQEISWNGHSYWFRPEPTTWVMARNACNDQVGYHLVVVNTADEQLYLHQEVSSRGGWWWLGYNDRATESIWMWVTGAWSETTNWAYGEPGKDNAAQDCAYMRPNGLWYAGECSSTRRYICERDY